MDSAGLSILAKLMARRVEFCAELIRQMGYDFPKIYDLRLRVDTDCATHDQIMRLSVDDTVTRYRIPYKAFIDYEPKDGQDDLTAHTTRAAGELVSVYCSQHQHLAPSRELADKVIAWLDTEQSQKEIEDLAYKAANGSTYTEKT